VVDWTLSVKETSICILDYTALIVKEVKVASETGKKRGNPKGREKGGKGVSRPLSHSVHLSRLSPSSGDLGREKKKEKERGRKEKRKKTA